MVGCGCLAVAAMVDAGVSPNGRLRVGCEGNETTVSYDGHPVVVVSGIGADTETCVMDAGFAWREPGDGVYAFDFGEDARSWPVSHAQGKYLPLPLSKLGEQAPIPGSAAAAAGKGRMVNYDPGT